MSATQISSIPMKGCPFIPCHNLATAKFYEVQANAGETSADDWYEPSVQNLERWIASSYFVCLLN